MVFDVQIQDNPPDRDTAEYICYQTGTDIYYKIEPTSGWTPAWVKLYIKSGGTTIREQSLSTGVGEQTAYWDGKNDGGQWVEPGNYTAEIRVIKSRADCSDTHSITVVEVASLLASGATEFDDGDGNPDTKSYYVCGATSGVVTVTATPNPSVAEADLPECWTLEGGTGTSKLVRTVSKTDGGVHTITCTAGTSSKTVTIYVYGHTVNFRSVNCDPAPTTNHYGATIYYKWWSTTGDNCDLANCFISESFFDYYEDRPPFYGSAPDPSSEMSMDIDFNSENFGDGHGIRKDLVHDYTEGTRSYGQFLEWMCYKCGASGTLCTPAVGQTVYDKAPNPPPNNWYITTDIYPDCPGESCHTDEDILE